MRWTSLLITVAAGSLLVGCIDTSGLVFDREQPLGAGAGAPSGYAAAVMDDGPIGYWPLDEVEFSDTPDLSPSGQEGRIDEEMGSAELASDGILGNALTLTDGARAYVDVPNPYGFGGVPYTLEAWVRVPPGEGGNLMSATGSGQPGYSTFIGSPQGSTSQQVTHKRYSGTDNYSHGVDVDFDELRHLVIAYDAGNQNLLIYIDGVELSDDDTVIEWSDNPSQFVIGAADFENGTITIDEVAVYDKVLSEDRIQHHYTCATSSCPE